jgi:multicomponent Na+:H+ antiporter subunit C
MSLEMVAGLYNYWIVIFLMMTGFYIVIARENFIKTIIGLNIFQISVILLYVTMGKVNGGTAPIVPPEIAARYAVEHHDDDSGEIQFPPGTEHGAELSPDDRTGQEEVHQNTIPENGSTGLQPNEHRIDYSVAGGPDETVLGSSDLIYSNPLPSVLMLTAIVVGIATTALALALIVRIREDYGTIEENEVLELDRKA